MTAASQGSSTIVHLLFHGIGVPGPRGLKKSTYFVSAICCLLSSTRCTVIRSLRSALTMDTSLTSRSPCRRSSSAACPPDSSRWPAARPAGSAGRGRAARADRRRDEIGSHGMRHRSWRRHGPRRTARGTDRGAANAVRPRPMPRLTTAACPFGDYDRGALSALRAQGYSTVFTSDRRRARRGAWLQPRYSVRARRHLADGARHRSSRRRRPSPASRAHDHRHG